MKRHNLLLFCMLCVVLDWVSAGAQAQDYSADAELMQFQQQIEQTDREIRRLESLYGHTNAGGQSLPAGNPPLQQPAAAAVIPPGAAAVSQGMLLQPPMSHPYATAPGHGVVGAGYGGTVQPAAAFIPITAPGFDLKGRPLPSGVTSWPPHTISGIAAPATPPPEFQFASDGNATSDDGMDVSSLLAEFEKRWEEQQEINDELRSQISKSVQPGTKLGTMKIVGRVHLDHWAFPDESPGVNAFERLDSTQGPQDRVLFRRMRFGVRGDVWENMEYRIEMEFGGGDDSQFRDAWLGFQHLPFLQTVRIGNQKRPYGLDHLNSSRYNVFIERPFIVEAFNQDSRRVGIQSWGVSEDEVYNWRFGIFNQRLIQDEGSFISDHYQGEVTGRIASTWWYDECSDGRGYGHWAVSGSVAHPDGSTGVPGLDIGPDINEARFRTRPEARSSLRWLNTGFINGADWYQLLGLEGVFNAGPVQIVGEHMNIWLQRDAGTGPDVYFHGGYVYLSYFLTGEHIPWNRKTGTLGRVKPFENFFLVDKCCGGTGGGWGAWQVALRLSYGDLTDGDIPGGVGESVTFGMNWHWNDNARVQFNYIYGEISERSLTDINGQTFTGGSYQVAGTRFMIDF